MPELYFLFKGNQFIKKEGDNFSIGKGFDVLYSKIIDLGFSPTPRNLEITHDIFLSLWFFFNHFSTQEDYWHSDNFSSVILQDLNKYDNLTSTEKDSLHDILTQFCSWFINEYNPNPNPPSDFKPINSSIIRLIQDTKRKRSSN